MFFRYLDQDCSAWHRPVLLVRGYTIPDVDRYLPKILQSMAMSWLALAPHDLIGHSTQGFVAELWKLKFSSGIVNNLSLGLRS